MSSLFILADLDIGLQTHEEALCMIKFSLFSVTSVDQVIQFFLYDIQILLCVDHASQICTMSKFNYYIPISCSQVITT